MSHYVPSLVCMTTQSTPTQNPVRSPGAVRLDVDALAPRASRAMASLDAASRQTSIEPGLLELVRMRASQINGCAYCVDSTAPTRSRAASPSVDCSR